MAKSLLPFPPMKTFPQYSQSLCPLTCFSRQNFVVALKLHLGQLNWVSSFISFGHLDFKLETTSEAQNDAFLFNVKGFEIIG